MAVACDDVDNTRREACFSDEIGKAQRRQRSLLRRLEHERTAGCESGSDLESRHQKREVPRHDLDGDSHGLP